MFSCEKNYSCCNYQYADALDELWVEGRDCPHLIEVGSVVHVHWIWRTDSTGERECVCSSCGGELPYTFTGGTVEHPFVEKEYIGETNYCPHCGARMVEE